MSLAKVFGLLAAAVTLVCGVAGLVLAAAPYNDDLGTLIKSELKNAESFFFEKGSKRPPARPIKLVAVRSGDASPCPECGMAEEDTSSTWGDGALDAQRDFGAAWSEKPRRDKPAIMRVSLRKKAFNPALNGFDDVKDWDW